MKIKIETLTGQTFGIKVNNKATVRDVKKEIYRSGNITGVVRIVRGQYVLPDDSTLAQHSIKNRTTVNVVVEPDKQINIHIKLNPKTFSHTVSHSITVNELKRLLIEQNQVAFPLEEFSLALANEEGRDTELSDLTLPLHDYDVMGDTTLNVVTSYMTLNIVNRKNESYVKKFSKNITVSEMKQLIKSVPSLLSIASDVLDITLFSKGEHCYVKLPEKSNSSIGEMLSDGDTLYFIEEKFFSSYRQMPVYSNGQEVGKVAWEAGDSVLSVKLRAQDQFGLPVSCFNVSHDNRVCADNQYLTTRYTVSQFRMNIK